MLTFDLMFVNELIQSYKTYFIRSINNFFARLFFFTHEPLFMVSRIATRKLWIIPWTSLQVPYFIVRKWKVLFFLFLISMNTAYGYPSTICRQGEYTVVNGTAWFYENSVSNQELRDQNFRLTSMLIDYYYWTSQQQCYYYSPPMDMDQNVDINHELHHVEVKRHKVDKEVLNVENLSHIVQPDCINDSNKWNDQ